MDTITQRQQQYEVYRKVNIAQLLVEIRVKAGLSEQEIAHILGTSFTSVVHWENSAGRPSPEQIKRILEIYEIVNRNSGASLTAKALEGAFTSTGVRATSVNSVSQNLYLFPELAPPTVKLLPEPNTPILDRLMHDAVFSANGFAAIEQLLGKHAESAPTVVKAASGNMSAGKNTYTYDAHTYHTKVPPQGIAELLRYYLPSGGLILDPFAGSGMTGVASRVLGYDCILNELSPAASFIANRFSQSIDPALFEAGVRAVLEELQDLREVLYTTECRECGKSTEILYTIWSYNVICDHCGHEFLLWDHAQKYGNTVREHKIQSRFPCPNCSTIVKKSYLQRTTSEPVVVVYKCCNPEYQHHPVTDDDTQRLRRIHAELSPAEGFFPTTRLKKGVNLLQPIKHGLNSIDKFYSRRNLIAMSHLWRVIHRVNHLELAAHLAFVFTSLYQRVTQLAEFRFWGGSGNMARFNVPFVFKEANVFDTFERKARSIRDHLESTARHYQGQTVVMTGSATELSYLPNESFDLIFTDPPFGANINYSEMNILWESWLGRFTDSTHEAIINKFQKKGVNEYKKLMTQSLQECYRVLRPGHWMLLVFMNSSQEVWAALRSAVANAGFLIRQVNIFDKQHGTFKQFVDANTAGADLILHCQRPYEPDEIQVLPSTNLTIEDGILDFLQTIDLATYRQLYLHVDRDEEINYRTLYSEWLSLAIINDLPTVDFAQFRRIVQSWSDSQNRSAI